MPTTPREFTRDEPFVRDPSQPSAFPADRRSLTADEMANLTPEERARFNAAVRTSGDPFPAPRRLSRMTPAEVAALTDDERARLTRIEADETRLGPTDFSGFAADQLFVRDPVTGHFSPYAGTVAVQQVASHHAPAVQRALGEAARLNAERITEETVAKETAIDNAFASSRQRQRSSLRASRGGRTI